MVLFLKPLNVISLITKRNLSELKAVKTVLEKCPPYIQLCKDYESEDPALAVNLIKAMHVAQDFLSVDEEKSLVDEVDPDMRKIRYEFDHWDDAIHGYRERERLKWNNANAEVINRVRDVAFPPDVAQLEHVHVLDLDAKGYIKPHIDAVRFCGDIIAGLSLLSDSVMRLVHDKQKNLYADILLSRRSLYIMKGTARFDYTHEILENKSSIFDGVSVPRGRRISVICRNKPDPKYNS